MIRVKMLTVISSYIAYIATLLSFLIDYLLGNGFVELFQGTFRKAELFIQKPVEHEQTEVQITQDDIVSFPVFVAEVIFLGLIVALLNKYKKVRYKDSIDDLLRESREALRQTNELLEKWRLRRIQMPTKYSYLDEEPQEIKPFNLGVPVLHMAIIARTGSTRFQRESSDADGFTDSPLLSIPSLHEDSVSIPDEAAAEKIDESKNDDLRNRILWDVFGENTVNLDV